MGIGDDLQQGITAASSLIGENPLISIATAGVVGAGVGVVAGSVLGSSSSKKVKKSSKKRKTKKVSKRRKQKKPYTAGKAKDRSHRRIRYTKNNQPYIILASGKARFISKRSAANSRKRKGGRY